jgi:hypothetical protein
LGDIDCFVIEERGVAVRLEVGCWIGIELIKNEGKVAENDLNGGGSWTRWLR